MLTFGIQSIQDFISAHQLKRVDGNILFDAAINFYSGDTMHSIDSPVQIIMLPNKIAVYILEFLKETYHLTEMYSTGHYHFKCSNAKALEIRKEKEDDLPLISILPL